MPTGFAQGTYKRWSNVDTGDTDTDHITIDYRAATKSRICEECLEGRKGQVLKVLICLLLFFLGLTIGYFIKKGQPDVTEKNTPHGFDYVTIRQKALSKINATMIESTLREFTRYLHQAGTSNSDSITDVIKERWSSCGLQNVHQKSYKVLLSYFDQYRNDLNTVILYDKNNVTNVTIENRDSSDLLENSAPKHDTLRAFNAYAPTAKVKGEPVFVNYGREKDFKLLDKKNVNYTGKILIIKQGATFLGDTVRLAEQYGALGIITYPDPHDYALDTHHLGPYPNTWWLPSNRRQWGTVGRLDFGDPLTPDLPALSGAEDNPHNDPMDLKRFPEDMYGINVNDADLPRIPVQGVSWGSVRKIMKFMKAGPRHETPTSGLWKGNLPNDPGVYNLGPGYYGDREGWTVELNVNNKLQLKKIINVFGMLKGSEEPDRYVIVGSHHDSWTYGAIDPGSGLSILMELSRVFGEMVTKERWRPRRTIIFASFDAEKFGRIGSREWVEEYEKELSERGVAFICLDIGLSGNNSFSAESDLMLRQLVYDTVKNTTSPFKNHKTLYSFWNQTAPSKINKDTPKIPRMGAGGDFTNFIHQLGIPSLDMTYTSQFSDVHWGRYIYPSYNTAIDTYRYVKNFIDKDFDLHAHLAGLYASVILRLSTEEQLPLVEDDTIEALNIGLSLLKQKRPLLDKLYDVVHNAVQDFVKRSDEFQNQFNFDRNRTNHSATVRSYNDRIMKVSRAFICRRGLTSRPYLKNLLVGPSADNAYKAEVFPGVQDALRNNNTDILVKEVWRIVLAVKRAARVLSDGFVTDNLTYL